MNKLLLIGTIVSIMLIGCSGNSTTKSELTESNNQTSEILTDEGFTIDFDKSKISDFTIQSEQDLSGKAIVKKLSNYSTAELRKLPSYKRIEYSITVPTFISKESLENTLKYFVYDKTTTDNDIDEIIIFVYDDKNDIGISGYTYGKLVWAPYGKLGNVSPVIASKNIRNNYQFEIDIKEKVGNISKKDIPTKRELDIYNMIMADEYLDMPEDKKNEMVMKKFDIKTVKEVEKIWLKVASYKY